MLEVAINVLAQARTLMSIGAIPIGAGQSGYYVSLNSHSHLQFAWNAPYASQLALVCRGAP